MASKPATALHVSITGKEKIYFASDFHLGAPNPKQSAERERKIIRWLEQASQDAKALFLVGDIFDFWFEYKHTIPKGFIRFLGKLAELRDQGIPIYFFTGNHDMWMFDYFPSELDIPVYKHPIVLKINGDKRVLVGHGDGLGPGDGFYKLLKVIFSNRFFQWLFYWLHPNLGMGIAHFWSKNSRITNDKKQDHFKGEDEWLLQYCKEREETEHFDYYVFGHRHLPLELAVAENATYYNLGEWVNHFTYLEIDEKGASLNTFDS